MMQLRQLPERQAKLLIRGSISQLPLHRTIRLIEAIDANHHVAYSGFERLAVAATLVSGIGNLRFGPEVGVTKPKPDAPVIDLWLERLRAMAADIAVVGNSRQVQTRVLKADARAIHETIEPESIDAVITSPPYPNEKDYTRTTRLESVLLGFLNDRRDLQALKRNLVKSNTRGVYKDGR